MVSKHSCRSTSWREGDYCSHVDGLRAVAVLSVILFHFDSSVVSGGFVGVDIFLVISGFLITRLIKREIEATGGISLRNFYVRRIRRLFPALFFTLTLTSIFAVLLFSPYHLVRFGEALVAAVFSISNFYFWFEADYFDSSMLVKPLLHTWSLSVEEQFYLVWPALLLLLIRGKQGWLAPLLILTLSFISVSLSCVFSDGEVSFLNLFPGKVANWFSEGQATIFYLLPFRVFEFGLGALIVWVPAIKRRSSVLLEPLLVIGLLCVLLPMFLYSEHMVFPSYNALLPCFGAGLIIYAGSARHAGRLLRNKYAVGIGLMSYSLYLLHWPYLVLFSYWYMEPLQPQHKLFLGLCVFLSACFSYRYVEIPFRTSRRNPKPVGGKTAYELLLASLVILGISFHDGWLWRLSDQTFTFASASEFHKQSYGGAGFPFYGPVNAGKPAKVLILGDSHGRHYAEGVSSIIAKPNELPLYLSAGTSCLHLPGFTRTTPGRDWDVHCPRRLQAALHYINSSDTSAIVIVSHFWTRQRDRAALLDDAGKRAETDVSNENIFTAISALKGLLGGRQLIVIGEVPGAHYDIYNAHARPTFLSRLNVGDFERSPIREEAIAFNKELREYAEDSNDFIFIDPHDVFCEEGSCRNVDSQGNIFYSDRRHLSRDGSRFVISKFESVFFEALEKAAAD